MADKQTGGKTSGAGPRKDQTTMPGQYPAKLAFGIAVPQSTGAPGTGGTSPASDPTMESPTPPAVFGAPADNMHTGSPGSSGASAGGASGASYTDPFKYLAGGGAGASTGGSTETEAAANKTGYDGPFGVHNPLSTGSGEGNPLIGGRKGK